MHLSGAVQLEFMHVFEQIGSQMFTEFWFNLYPLEHAHVSGSTHCPFKHGFEHDGTQISLLFSYPGQQ